MCSSFFNIRRKAAPRSTGTDGTSFAHCVHGTNDMWDINRWLLLMYIKECVSSLLFRSIIIPVSLSKQADRKEWIAFCMPQEFYSVFIWLVVPTQNNPSPAGYRQIWNHQPTSCLWLDDFPHIFPQQKRGFQGFSHQNPWASWHLPQLCLWICQSARWHSCQDPDLETVPELPRLDGTHDGSKL